MNTLWVEKHRPNTLQGYVFRDEAQKKQVEQWVKSKSIPHLLFSGGPGSCCLKLYAESNLFFTELLVP